MQFGYNIKSRPVTKEFEAGFDRMQAEKTPGPMPIDFSHYLESANPDETFPEWKERMRREGKA